MPCCLKPAVVGARKKLEDEVENEPPKNPRVKAGEQVLEKISTSQKYTLWSDDTKAAFAPPNEATG